MLRQTFNAMYFCIDTVIKAGVLCTAVYFMVPKHIAEDYKKTAIELFDLGEASYAARSCTVEKQALVSQHRLSTSVVSSCVKTAVMSSNLKREGKNIKPLDTAASLDVPKGLHDYCGEYSWRQQACGAGYYLYVGTRDWFRTPQP
jgi:hypothetical protein